MSEIFTKKENHLDVLEFLFHSQASIKRMSKNVIFEMHMTQNIIFRNPRICHGAIQFRKA